MTKVERDRLAGLVAQAKSIAPPTAPTDNSAQRGALHALYVWYREWSKMARVEITKRVYLIALGLAKRKSAKKPAPAPAPEPGKLGATPGKPAI